MLLEIPVNEIRSFDDIESIDDAAKRLDRSMEEGSNIDVLISPETEFWGHCSNLQAWYEYGYDTRLLHSNLAFPLLEKLVNVGDPSAKKVFKEELAKRLIAGSYSIIELMFGMDYIDLFSKEEVRYILEELNENKFEKYEYYEVTSFYLLEKLIKMGDEKAKQFVKEMVLKSLSKGFHSKICELYFHNFVDCVSREEFWSVFGADGKVLSEIERNIRKYKIIDGKKVYEKKFEEYNYFKLWDDIYPEIGSMVFKFKKGRVTGIGIFGNGSEIAEASDYYNYENVYNLEINKLSESIGKLNSLKVLILRNLGIKMLPETIKNLKELKVFSISGNSLTKLPDWLWDLKSLKILNLADNNLTTIPNLIERLENLQGLYLYGNNLKSIPIKSFEKLKKLFDICVDKEFDKSLDQLSKFKS
ncbi:MAG: leucine-rich repeat domain-containing protein [Promethearchaeota archaeon]